MAGFTGDAMSGAAQGAGMGAMLGPIGALGGAAVGAGASLGDSLMSRNEQKRRQKRVDEETFGKHRKLKKIGDAAQEAQQRKLVAMSGLSQAAMDWAQMIR